MLKIAFIFPLHNEEGRIRAVSKQLIYLKKNFNKYKIFFLLNDCNDKTEEIIKLRLKKYKFEILKFPKKNRGLGINYCIKNIKSKYFAICSVDNAWGFSFYKKAYEKLETNKGLKVIYGTKSHPNSIINRNFIRIVISFLSKIFLRTLFPEKPNHDTQCIKLFRRKLPFLKRLIGYNYFSETQFAILVKIFKVSSITIPVKVKKTPNSKVNILSLMHFVYEAIQYRFILIFNYLKND